MFQSLDIKAEGWGDLVNVLAIDFFEDGGFASIVESEHEEANLLFLLAVLLEDGEQTHDRFVVVEG